MATYLRILIPDLVRDLFKRFFDFAGNSYFHFLRLGIPSLEPSGRLWCPFLREGALNGMNKSRIGGCFAESKEALNRKKGVSLSLRNPCGAKASLAQADLVRMEMFGSSLVRCFEGCRVAIFNTPLLLHETSMLTKYWNTPSIRCAMIRWEGVAEKDA